VREERRGVAWMTARTTACCWFGEEEEEEVVAAVGPPLLIFKAVLWLSKCDQAI
jgi:hypothetical protein